MKHTSKMLLTATALIALSFPATAEILTQEKTTLTQTTTTKDEFASKNTVNRGHGQHYNAFSNDYRQPESLASAEAVAIQEALKAQGFYRGRVDGLWTDKTADAIRDYQESRGMSPTGKLSAAEFNDLGLAYRDVYTSGEMNTMNPAAGVSKTTKTTVKTTRE